MVCGCFMENKLKKIILGSIPIIIITTGIMIWKFCGLPDMEHYVIGIINPFMSQDNRICGFTEGLAGYGYVEGKNVTYIAYGKPLDVDAAVGDLVKRNVDLIFTLTTPGTLQWLLLAVPGIRQIYIPVKFDTPAATQSLEDLREAVSNTGIKLNVSEVNTQEELDTSLASIPEETDAIFVLRSIFIISNIDSIIDTALAEKLPAASSSENYKEGMLISYGTNRLIIGKQASRPAKMILKGIPASDIPIEVGEFFLGINLSTASVIGIDVQKDILFSTDNIAY